MAPLLNELYSKIELFYIKIGAINNYFTLIINYKSAIEINKIDLINYLYN